MRGICQQIERGMAGTEAGTKDGGGGGRTCQGDCPSAALLLLLLDALVSGVSRGKLALLGLVLIPVQIVLDERVALERVGERTDLPLPLESLWGSEWKTWSKDCVSFLDFLAPCSWSLACVFLLGIHRFHRYLPGRLVVGRIARRTFE